MHDRNALHMLFGGYPRPPLQSIHNIVPLESLLRPGPLGVTTQAFVNDMIGTIDFVNGEHMPTGNILSTTGSSTFMAGNAPPIMMQGRNFWPTWGDHSMLPPISTVSENVGTTESVATLGSVGDAEREVRLGGISDGNGGTTWDTKNALVKRRLQRHASSPFKAKSKDYPMQICTVEGQIPKPERLHVH